VAAEAKTKATAVAADSFLATVDAARQDDCRTIAALMQRATGEPAVMWGSNIVGFGRYRYEYANGTTGDWPLVAFSPRKTDLTLYLKPEFATREALLAKLGKHKTGKSCVYVKKLADVDAQVLKTLIEDSVNAMAPQRVRPD